MLGGQYHSDASLLTIFDIELLAAKCSRNLQNGTKCQGALRP